MLSKLDAPGDFVRPHAKILANRLREPRRFLQVLTGARQVGKTTLARQVVGSSGLPVLSVSADEPSLRGGPWLEQQWERARDLARSAGRRGAVLVVDEVQKVDGWAEAVKRRWDEDTAEGVALRVVLLGSAPLLVQQGLTESLAGRFEILRLPHWSFPEMKACFGWDIERHVLFGGYPGAAGLVDDPERWTRYIKDSLIETTIARDVLLLTRVDKPALLRRLFELACRYSGQVLAYQKMLGQLVDAGNTTTLAHYLDLLGTAGMVTGLQKYAGDASRRRGSSPKLLVLNTALMTALAEVPPAQMRKDPERWGRLVESAVGAHLANARAMGEVDLFYWRDGDREVDFVLRKGDRVAAIEVKSGRSRGSTRGMESFQAAHRVKRPLLVGGDGIPIEVFLSAPVSRWVE